MTPVAITQEARPDLIVVMTDQQRHDQVGYSSGGHFETPVLDRLATQGVIFDTAYSASTVCVPARSALLTGLQPHRLPSQENGMALREGFWTVAHALRKAGYETALIGKMHFAPVHAEHGFETMRLCEHLSAQALGPLSHARGDTLDDYHHWLLERGLPDRRLETVNRSGRWELPADAHPTAWVEREVTSFLAHRDDSRPLFLVVSFPHPHAPYDPPEPYASMYSAEDSLIPEHGYELNENLPLVLQLATSRSTTRAAAADPDHLRAFLAIVRGLIRQIDDSIGRLVERLDLGSSVLLFTSDHGDYAGHRGLLRKNPWLPFDDLARVPLMAVGSGVSGGRRIEALVQSSDIALTCLDLAGLTPPERVEFDSRSLVPLLVDHDFATDDDRSVLCATTFGVGMVRQGRYKYLDHRDLGEPVLFDLVDDPHESVNKVADPRCREIAETLGQVLAAARAQPVLEIPA